MRKFVKDFLLPNKFGQSLSLCRIFQIFGQFCNSATRRSRIRQYLSKFKIIIHCISLWASEKDVAFVQHVAWFPFWRCCWTKFWQQVPVSATTNLFSGNYTRQCLSIFLHSGGLVHEVVWDHEKVKTIPHTMPGTYFRCNEYQLVVQHVHERMIQWTTRKERPWRRAAPRTLKKGEGSRWQWCHVTTSQIFWNGL